MGYGNAALLLGPSLKEVVAVFRTESVKTKSMENVSTGVLDNNKAHYSR